MARKSNYIINRKNTELWKEDTLKSVSLYNDWLLDFAPVTYTKERKCAMEQVELAISQTDNFHFTATHLKEHPEFITILRMATTPPTMLTLFFSYVAILIAATSATKQPKELIGYGNIE